MHAFLAKIDQHRFKTNGKENLEDYPPSEEKLRPLLSLRKKKTSPLQECAVNVSRFADPVSQEEMEIAAQGVVPDNTKRNNKWAANNFAEWAKARTQSLFLIIY